MPRHDQTKPCTGAGDCLLPSCGPCNAETEEAHSCPFAEEIHDDPSERCHCSAVDTYECAMDI